LKPNSLFIVSLALLLLVGPGYGQQRRSTTSQTAKQEQAPAQPAAPPPTLAQLPATPPQVSFQAGQLTISAQNSTLGDILKAVRAQTGATIDLPGTAPERVVGQFGPAPARDVLASLLNGSHFNYLLLGSPTDPSALDRVILMAKSGSAVESSPPPAAQQASAYNQNVYARPLTPMPAPGANTVVVEGQDAQDDTADDSADSTDDAQADDQTDQTDQTDDQAATDDQQQQPQQDGQQQVKTPEQLLQELQQRQQQLQQQGVQPGVPPGMRPFPNPGMPGQPGQPGDGTNTPPHN
jgi:hypothetical protein